MIKVMTKENKISFILNLIIFICVLPCTILSFTRIPNVGGGLLVIKYFTLQSNILAGAVGLSFVIYYLLIKNGKKAKIPKMLYILKFIATVDLTLTFFTVLLFLAPGNPNGFFALYAYTNAFFHFLVPILTFVSFLFFESKFLFNFKITFVGMIHLICYTIVYCTLALSHFGENGKPDMLYDWYGYAQNGTGGMIISLVVSLLGTYLFCVLLWLINNKMHNKKSANR